MPSRSRHVARSLLLGGPDDGLQDGVAAMRDRCDVQDAIVHYGDVELHKVPERTFWRGDVGQDFSLKHDLGVSRNFQVDRFALDQLQWLSAQRARLERAQLVLESDQRASLQGMLCALMPLLYAIKLKKDVRWHIDVDPAEL